MAKHEPPTDQDSRNEFLWNVHSFMNEYIRFADTKAQLVIGWATAIAGTLVASDFLHPMEFTPIKVARLASVLLLALAVASAIFAINPRLRTKQPKGYIFWLSILGHGSRDSFLQATDTIGASEAGEHVASHLYDLSGVCRDKYWWVNVSILLAFVGSTFSGILYLFR